jgi:hypothetical protein
VPIDDDQTRASTAGVTMPAEMNAEAILAELNRLRNDLDKDPEDIEWLTLHHAFCFISYKIGEFERYVKEQDEHGAFDEFKKAQL